jgi:hypothetical protein
MSNDQVDAVADLGVRVHGAARTRKRHTVLVGGVLLLGLGGVSACGDDDDASDTVTGQTAESAESSVAATEPTTTRASTTTARPTTTAAAASTAAAATAVATVEDTEAAATEPPSAAAVAETSEATGAGAATTTTSARAVTTTAATESTLTEGSVPAGSEPESTIPESSGPTTTGPECQFTENDEFPIERCDAGPAIAAMQSVLQALEYDIGTVDCLFGDQTLYAVRAFQGDEELTVTGTVDAETWAALEETFLPGWGTDANGNGTIEPDEITLECA